MDRRDDCKRWDPAEGAVRISCPSESLLLSSASKLADLWVVRAEGGEESSAAPLEALSGALRSMFRREVREAKRFDMRSRRNMCQKRGNEDNLGR